MMKCVLTFFLIMYSLIACSERLLVTGKPVSLEYHQGFFTFPPSYRTPLGYHYVSLSVTNRVCYLDRKPQLDRVDMLQLTIEENKKQFLWNCYEFDPRYFVKDY